MAPPAIMTAIERYLAAVNAAGIPVTKAVLFGSQVRGAAHAWSDIDLIVVSPRFDTVTDREAINLLWRIAASVDSRIEPLPCGVRQWEEDDSSAILEIARREGEVLQAA